MKAASDYQRVVEGCYSWEVYDPEVKADCSCCALNVAGGLVFVDPVPLEEEALAQLIGEAGVGPVGVLVTSGNHERWARELAERYRLPVAAHPDAAAELGLDRMERYRVATEAVAPFPGTRVFELEGGAAGEIALHVPMGEGVLVVGDALVDLPDAGLSVLPDKYCASPSKLRRSLSKLLLLEYQTMLMAHGRPVVDHPMARLRALLGE